MKTLNHLFSPLHIRSVTLKNRIIVPPMCQYQALKGHATDWHRVHLGQFALGGAGLIIFEATAVTKHGRISHGDLGLWRDSQAKTLKPIVKFIQSQDSLAGIQLAHAGRKGSATIPWGSPPRSLHASEQAWQTLAPSAIPYGAAYRSPRAMTKRDIRKVVDGFASAAKRAQKVGFDVLEIHAAHGYLLASFLSSISNQRQDRYGETWSNRIRLLEEVIEAVQSHWPEDKPLFVKLSCVDGHSHGWTLEDSIDLAKRLKQQGVDLIDCSSGGIEEIARSPHRVDRFRPGWQVLYAQAIRQQANIMTQAVGGIITPQQANAIIQNGQADCVGVGRESLVQPNWAHQAARELKHMNDLEHIPLPYRYTLQSRKKAMEKTFNAPYTPKKTA